MTVITESELREMWKNGTGQLPTFPADARFSASAKDFIKSQNINIILGVKPDSLTYPFQDNLPTTNPDWNNPGSFPVKLSGPVPICSECGQPLHLKPEHMTQIDSGRFANKTSPRLILRGRIDSLHAFFMLTAAISRRFELLDLANYLDSLSAYCREIMSAEYNMRPVAALYLMGKDEEQLHDISHRPEKYLGISHLVPGKQDHEILHWLNMLRTQCREVEIVSLQTFPQDSLDNNVIGSSISRAFNRLSSAVYVLELYFRAGIINWKVSG